MSEPVLKERNFNPTVNLCDNCTYGHLTRVQKVLKSLLTSYNNTFMKSNTLHTIVLVTHV